MGEVAPVGIHNDLPSGEARVPIGAAHHKIAGGIDVDVGHLADIEAVALQHRGNDPIPDVGPQVLHSKILAVHDGHHHGLDALHIALLVKLHADLGLAVRPQQVILPDALRQPIAQGPAQGGRQRHQLRSLGAGSAEHHALVSGAAYGIVGAQGNVRGLGMDAALDLHRVGIEAVLRPGVANGPDGLPGNGSIVYQGLGGDLPADQAEVGGDHGLTGHPGGRILTEAFVQDGIGDGVRHLVRVAHRDAFRGKESFFHVCFFLSVDKKTAHQKT